jgi:hypothetical protein
MDLDEPLKPESLPSDFDPDAESEPDWKIYEQAITHIEESYENCQVTRNHKLVGRHSGVRRQIDVWLSAEIGDKHTVTVAIECRRYNRPVAIKDIDAFCGFLDDVGANKGVIISHAGFTEGATKRAEGAGIELKILNIEEAEEFDWNDFLRDSCRTPECFGTISWHFADGQSEAGHCSNCGSFYIRCGNCGSVDWYNEGEIEKCSWFCEMRWRLLKEKGMTVGIKELAPSSDESDEEAEEEV